MNSVPTLQVDNTSVRAKSKRPAEGAQKTAFRPVLDNPLPISWPPLSAPVRKLILDALLAFLKRPFAPDELPIADWRLQEHARRRGRVHGAGKGKGNKDATAKGPDEAQQDAKAPPLAKKAKRPPAPSDRSVPTPTHSITLRSDRTIDVPILVDKPRPPRPRPAAPPTKPQLLNHLSIGINDVTRALESRIRWGRWELGDSSAAPGGAAVPEPEPPAPAAAPSTSAVPDATSSSPDPSILSTPPPPKTRRRRHSAHPSSIPPPAAVIPSITHERPSFRFLDHSLPRPSTRLPPYLLPPTEISPFFRLLANAHSLKLKRKKEGDTWLRSTLQGVKKRDVQNEMLQDVIAKDRRTLAQLEGPPLRKGAGAKSGKGEPARALGGGKGKGKAGSRVYQTAVVVNLEEGREGGDTETQSAQNEEMDDVEWVHMIDVVFVCRPDINPTSLVDHLPTMAAAANGVKEAMDAVLESSDDDDPSTSAPNDMVTDQVPDQPPVDSTAPSRPAQHFVYLVPLDLGAEQQLGEVLALRRVAAIGLSSLAPGVSPLLYLVRQHVKPLLAPWLVPHVSNPVPRPSTAPVRRLVPTHVKHLRTTAPVDMKGANAKAKAGRKAAKKRKRDEGQEEQEEQDVYMAED